MKLEGWTITTLVFLALAILFAFVLLPSDITEENIRALVRYTANSSLLLFVSTFSASSLRYFIKNNFTAWLLANRRYLGLSFAVSHIYHLAALISLGVLYPYPFLDKLNSIPIMLAAVAYIFIFAMSITSFKVPRLIIGELWWKRLHYTGSYFIWLIFAYSFGTRYDQGWTYIAGIILLLGVYSLRTFKQLKSKQS